MFIHWNQLLRNGPRPEGAARLADAAAGRWHLTHAGAPRSNVPPVEHLEYFHSAAGHVGYVLLLTGQYVTGAHRAPEPAAGSQQRGVRGLKLGWDERALFCRAAVGHTSPHVSRTKKKITNKKTNCQPTAVNKGWPSKELWILKQRAELFGHSLWMNCWGNSLKVHCRVEIYHRIEFWNYLYA